MSETNRRCQWPDCERTIPVEWSYCRRHWGEAQREPGQIRLCEALLRESEYQLRGAQESVKSRREWLREALAQREKEEARRMRSSANENRLQHDRILDDEKGIGDRRAVISYSLDGSPDQVHIDTICIGDFLIRTYQGCSTEEVDSFTTEIWIGRSIIYMTGSTADKNSAISIAKRWLSDLIAKYYVCGAGLA